MRIGLITQGGVNRVPLKEKADVVICAFETEEVRYDKELKGETDYFERVARLSKTLDGVVVCGVKTDARGHKRKSALIAENGTILGVSDMCNVVDGECSCGAEMGVYNTKAGKMGVVVAGDLRFPEVFQTLANVGCAFVVCTLEKAGEMEMILARAHAYCYGMTVCFCGIGCAGIALPSGELAFSTQDETGYVKCKCSKEYHLVETRKKGTL